MNECVGGSVFTLLLFAGGIPLKSKCLDTKNKVYFVNGVRFFLSVLYNKIGLNLFYQKSVVIFHQCCRD